MTSASLGTSIKTVQLRHITSPYAAVQIANSGMFLSFNNPGHYDCGMNFLGVLGEYSNTQPKYRGATLLCTWTGEVSPPLHYEFRPHNLPNVLYDFNGSGKHFRNNDPRYLLPYESRGLVLNEINFDSENDLVPLWLANQKWFVKVFCKIGLTNQWQLKRARHFTNELNKKCRNGKVLIDVCRGLA
jgi:hypothetical protein